MMTPSVANRTTTPSLENRTLYNTTLDYSTNFTEHNWLNSDSFNIHEDFFNQIEEFYDEKYNIINILKAISITWYSVTMILGIVGNGLVIWIAGFKMKTVSAVWFLNLAIADFVTCISLPIRISEWALYWDIPYNNLLCKIGVTILFINMLSSVYFMAVISIDRCVCVFWPIWTKIHRTPRLATIIAVLVWLLCLLTSIPHLVFNHGLDGVTECYPKYDTFCVTNMNMKRSAMFITRNICMFSVPFIIILISCCLIFFKIRAIRKPNRSPKPFRIVTAVIGCFFICWFPYNTWPFITLETKYMRADMVITEVSICLAYFSSCINPLLYVFFFHDFKKNFVKSIPDMLENALTKRPDLNCLDNATSTFPTLNLESSLV